MTTRGHLLDGATIALWRFDDSPGSVIALDEANKRNLNQSGTPLVASGLINDGGRARRFPTPSSFYNYTPGSDGGLATMIQGEFSVEAWINLDAYGVGVVSRFLEITDGLNRLVEVSVDPVGGLDASWISAGVSQFFSAGIGTILLKNRYHVGMKKVSLGGGNYRIDLFINGVKVGSSGSLLNTTGASPGIMIEVGSGVSGSPFIGVIDDLRISNIARSDVSFLTSYQRGITDSVPSPPISALGHKLDTNTLALWRLDEVNPAALAVDSAPGARSLTAPGSAPSTIPGIVQDSGNAKLFYGRGAYSRVGVDAPVLAALLGEWTIEAWIRPDDLPAVTYQRIFNAGQVAGSEAMRWEVSPGTSKIGLNWDYNVGTNSVSIQDPTVLNSGQVYHVAARKRIDTVNAGKYIVGLFVNGVKTIETSNLNNTDATGASLLIGGAGTAGFFKGAIDDVRFSNIARNDTEIFQSYRRGSSSQVRTIQAQGHKLDNNTLALWRLDESSGSSPIVDAVGIYNLVQGGTGAPTVVAGLISDSGKARRFINGFYSAIGDAALTAALQGEFTIEAWISLDSIPVAGDGRIVDIQCSNTNFPRLVWFTVTTAAHIQGLWHNGTVPQSQDDTTTLITGTRYHVSMRKVSVGGGGYRIDIFINGVKSSSSGPGANTTGTGNATIEFGSGIGGTVFPGIIDDIRISKIARTDSEIYESYRRGIIDQSDLSDFSLGATEDSNTVFLWRLNESSGDLPALEEISGLSLDPLGIPSVVQGRISGAREVGNNIQFAKTITPIEPYQSIIKSGNYTAEAWIYIDPNISYPATWPGAGNGHGAIFSYSGTTGTGFMYGLDATGFFHYNSNQGFVTAGSWQNLTRGTWHHFAVRCTSTSPTQMNIDFFIDGLLVAFTTSVKWTATALVTLLTLGAEAVTFNQFDGYIDDVRFSNVSRTDDEIFQTYHRAEIIYDLQSPAALRGTDRLLQQYKDAIAVGVREVVAEGSNEVQDVNDAMNSFDPGLFSIATATGLPLELLGKLVGELRNGRADDIYRLWVSARVRANRSNGSIEDIIDVFRILTAGTGLIQVVEYQPARIVVKVNQYNVVLPNEFLSILRLTRKAGVAYNLEYSTAAKGLGFRFAGGVAGAGKGFPDASLTPGSGGKLAGVK